MMIIVGAGAAGIEVLYILQTLDYKHDIFFYDEKHAKSSISNFRVLNKIQQIKNLDSSKCNFCVAIGNPRKRKKLFTEFISHGFTPANIISKEIINLSKFEENSIIIQPGVSISFDVKLSASCMIHTNSVISHNVTIESFVNISPLCTILSDVLIGEQTYIGAGSVIQSGIKIGKNAYITPGSVVKRNIADFETF